MRQKFEVQTLNVKGGMVATIHPLGARLISLVVPSASGPTETLLRYSNLEAYINDPFFLGATVGRYANRIAGGRVRVNDREYELDSNEKSTGHCLHGGRDGLYRQVWALHANTRSDSVTCHHRSTNGSQGFPGNIEITVTYQILSQSSLAIDFAASSDAETVLNLANHAYFNLNDNQQTIDSHELIIHADHYTPLDVSMIPTGQIAAVDNTHFDFRRCRRLGDLLGEQDEASAYDINYVLEETNGELRLAAELYSPESDLRLRVSTTQPGLQLYTGDNLSKPFVPRQGLCLEAQNFPNAPNQTGFPSARLAPGMTYRHRSIYEIS